MAAHDPSSPELQTTAHLLALVRDGDRRAREALMGRFLPVLRRWARGRLPGDARSLADTDDLVQVTLIRALNSVQRFRSTREGAFLAYLRQTLLNAMRDEIRRSVRGPSREPVDDHLADGAPSLLEQMIGRDAQEAYEQALLELSPEQREGVVLRLEFGYGYEDIAVAIGSPSANAARMMISRSLLRLADALDAHWKPG